jgi:hypothetical protein
LSDKLVERLREPRAVYWGNGAGPLLLAAADRIEALEQALREALERLEEGLESEGDYEPDWSESDRIFIQATRRDLFAHSAAQEPQ